MGPPPEVRLSQGTLQGLLGLISEESQQPFSEAAPVEQNKSMASPKLTTESNVAASSTFQLLWGGDSNISGHSRDEVSRPTLGKKARTEAASPLKNSTYPATGISSPLRPIIPSSTQERSGMSPVVASGVVSPAPFVASSPVANILVPRKKKPKEKQPSSGGSQTGIASNVQSETSMEATAGVFADGVARETRSVNTPRVRSTKKNKAVSTPTGVIVNPLDMDPAVMEAFLGHLHGGA